MLRETVQEPRVRKDGADAVVLLHPHTQVCNKPKHFTTYTLLFTQKNETVRQCQVVYA